MKACTSVVARPENDDQADVMESVIASNEAVISVVDQFEELFRFKQESKQTDAGDEAAAFVKLLLEVAQQLAQSIYVVLTMRSDVLDNCAQFRDLSEAMNDRPIFDPTSYPRPVAGSNPVSGGGGCNHYPSVGSRLLNPELGGWGGSARC